MTDENKPKIPGIGKLDTMADVLAKKPIEIQAGVCARARSRENDCRRCGDACLAGAISFSDDKPLPVNLDFARCNGCGACVTTCPTGVFDYVGGLTDFELLKKMVWSIQGGHPEPFFTCHKIDESMRSRSVETVCLARVHEGLLIGAAKFGAKKVSLVAGDCGDCGYASREAFSLRLKAAGALAKRLKLRTEFVLTDFHSLADISGRAALIEKEQPTRRELLENMGGFFSRMTASWMEKTLAPFLPKEKLVVSRGFVYKVPSKRRLLLSLIADLKGRAKMVLPELSLADIVFDAGKCNFCERCALFCPTTALAVEDHADGTHLVFYPAYCVDCGLCVGACRRQALALTPQIDLGDLIGGQGRALISAGSRYECRLCGLEFAGVKPAGACPTCAELQELQGNSESLTALKPKPVEISS